MKTGRIFTITLKKGFNRYEKQYLIIIFVFSSWWTNFTDPSFEFPRILFFDPTKTYCNEKAYAMPRGRCGNDVSSQLLCSYKKRLPGSETLQTERWILHVTLYKVDVESEILDPGYAGIFCFMEHWRSTTTAPIQLWYIQDAASI